LKATGFTVRTMAGTNRLFPLIVESDIHTPCRFNRRGDTLVLESYRLHRRSELHRLRKNYALYQGTTLVGPQTAENIPRLESLRGY
jgi:hypothetical protein